MRVVFFGTPEFSLPTLEALIKSSHEVALVVTRPNKPVGRRKIITPPPVAEVASAHGIDVIQPKKLKSAEVARRIQESGVDVGVVVAFGRLIPPNLLNLPEKGMVNIHPSLLPRHRGPSPIQWALVSGDSETGVSTMLLDEGMDTGPIFLQKKVRIEAKENAEQLSERLAAVGSDLLVRTLDGLEEGSLEATPQAEKGVSVTPMLRREFGEIDWSRPALQIVNRLRGFTPWPGTYTVFRGDRLKIFGLEEVETSSETAEAGAVVAVEPGGIVVQCGRGTRVRITEVQREGRTRMPVDAFLIGERVSTGEHLG